MFDPSINMTLSSHGLHLSKDDSWGDTKIPTCAEDRVITAQTVNGENMCAKYW